MSNTVMRSRTEDSINANSMLEKQGLKLLDLPNEILLQALNSIPTLTLLRRRLINHHFRDLIERIIRRRFLATTALNNWRLIIECYHPSRSQTEQYFFCDYQGTPGLDQTLGEKGESRLMSLLSYFKPTKETPERSFVRPHSAGDIPGSRTMDQVPRPKSTVADQVRRNINLESHENFSQLMFDASLVKLGPKKGVFDAVAGILDRKPIRIFRNWLSEQAKVTESKNSPSYAEKPGAQLLWVDELTKRAGLEVEVREKRWRSAMPILISRDEDQAMSYSVDLQGLRISTLHLSLAIEHELLKSGADNGRAMVFGSFPTEASENAQAS